jgi:hypothetical protein
MTFIVFVGYILVVGVMPSRIKIPWFFSCFGGTLPHGATKLESFLSKKLVCRIFRILGLSPNRLSHMDIDFTLVCPSVFVGVVFCGIGVIFWSSGEDLVVVIGKNLGPSTFSAPGLSSSR